MIQGKDSTCTFSCLPLEVLILFPADSYICRQDDNAREIFIIVHGTAKLLTGEEEHVVVSANNRSFCIGEEAFFNQLKRNCYIRCSWLNFVSLTFLNKEK